MEFSSQTLVPGVRFSPTDQELVQYYLYPKVTNPLFTTSAPVRDRDIYACQPLQIWNELHMIQGEDAFFFTNLKKKSPASNATRKIAGGPASWSREDSGKAIIVTIDKHCTVTATRKVFSYRSPETGHHGCRWTMYEYSLPSLSQDTVLCRMRRKDGSKSHPKKTKKRRRQADGVDDATNTMSQQARVGEGYHQQQITADPAETESESVYIYGMRFDDFESFSHELIKDFDNDQMAASSRRMIATESSYRPLHGRGGSDLADGVPSIQTTPEAVANPPYVVQENGIEMIHNAYYMEYPYGW
ncbi:hypothetical protein OIU77_018928 [Salix suchowensis]|uniref:NAC domain-containing protein n=1 Tax=Salix suchowensis TaxID=1278906 RepID=A0ABQ9CE43_9ROSI|nr:hypothetical protein OIU77_018928 [Salix suchowensis]